MVNLLVAAALAAAMPTNASADTSPAPPPAEPAMFVVRDADTTVYLFGTFHALDGQSQWFGDRVKNAFEQSNELVLETVIPE
ncbi:MAG: TraB/GumN family protein, partial [Sphingomicrobium sp.]